jgi:eukaryotic-like serine/threonine-protein kinase
VTLEMRTAARPSRDPVPPETSHLRTGNAAHDAVLDLVAAATSYDPAARPTAEALRAHPALRLLLELPPDPADPITITDVFPPLPETSSGGTVSRTAAYPPPTGPSSAPTMLPPPPPPPPRTLEETRHTPAPAPPAPGVLAPVLLILAGIVGLLVSAWLLIGG